MKVKPEVKISIEEIAKRPTIEGWDVVNTGTEIKDPALN